MAGHGVVTRALGQLETWACARGVDSVTLVRGRARAKVGALAHQLGAGQVPRLATGICVVLMFAGLAGPAVAQPEPDADYDVVVVGGEGVVGPDVYGQLGEATSGDIARLWGPNRFGTAAAVSSAVFEPGVPVVFVATGENFPDALAAGPEAALAGGPIVLVERDGVPEETAVELTRLAPERIVLLGGEAAVSAGVEATLGAFTEGPVERVWGADRYGTAAALSASRYTPGVDVVFVATGETYPDALTGGAAAAATGGPVLLTRRGEIPDVTAAELTRLVPGRIVLFGGTAAVSADVETALGAFTEGPVERLWGADRFATAAAISAATYPDGADILYVATGTEFPDALAVAAAAGSPSIRGFAHAPAAGSVRGPILLVRPGDIPGATWLELLRLAGDGGPANEPPGAIDASVTTSEDTSVEILLTGTDADGDSLVFALASNPVHGTLSGEAPALRYTPDAEFAGADSFTFTASDGVATSAPGVVDITVLPLNDPPVPGDVEAATGEDELLVVPAPGLLEPATDADADELSLEAVAGSSTLAGQSDLGAAVAAAADGSWSYDPRGVPTLEALPAGASAVDSFRFVVTDGQAEGTAVATVNVTGANDAPTDLALDNTSVAAGQPPGAVVGLLSATDVDDGAALAFSLAPGTGDDDNALFAVVGNELRTAAVLDFEVQPAHRVRVRADDGHGGTRENMLGITVVDRNEAPTAVRLSHNAVPESEPAGTVVGALSAEDQDADATHTFSLVAGDGDTDNGSFAVDGAGNLITAAVFDFEAKRDYTVRVQADDGAAGTVVQALTVTVTDVNEAPTSITLAPATVEENRETGTVVGALTATDPDAGATHTFTLVAGDGDTDNDSFDIDGTHLVTARVLDFEAQETYTIRVRANDGALLVERSLVVTVVDGLEADLVIDMDSEQDSCCNFSEITYLITVANDGPDDTDAPDTVTISDTLPDNVEFQRFGEESVNSCTYFAEERRVECTTQALDAFESVFYSFVVAAGVGTYVNVAVASSALAHDPDLSNNTASVTNTIVRFD